MSKTICPSCGADLKEVGFYINQSVDYVWDAKEERFVINYIAQNECLSSCCFVEIDDNISNAETLEELYSK